MTNEAIEAVAASADVTIDALSELLLVAYDRDDAHPTETAQRMVDHYRSSSKDDVPTDEREAIDGLIKMATGMAHLAVSMMQAMGPA